MASLFISLGLTGCNECRLEPLSSLIVLLNWELEEYLRRQMRASLCRYVWLPRTSFLKTWGIVEAGEDHFQESRASVHVSAEWASGAIHQKVIYFSKVVLL